MTGDSRRDFLKRAGLGAVMAGAAGRGVTVETVAAGAGEAPPKTVQKRVFGRLGREVSILGLGLGSAFTKAHEGRPDEAETLLLRALDHGVTYWDTARAYGISERLIGPLVSRVRERIFLVSKSARRDYDGFMRELETSLKNLRTDFLDLYHIHNLNPRRDQVETIAKGAARAAVKARDEGLIKAFGVTGHSGSGILIECIRRFDPDAVLTIFPCNRPENGRYEDELLPLARSRKMGVIAMKTVRMARQADLRGTDLIRYAMSLDGVHVTIVGLDTQAHLDENAVMAADFKPLTAGRRARMTRDSRLALAGLTAPWERPDYEDVSPV